MDTLLAKAEQDGKHVSEYGITLNAPYKIYDAVGCEKCNNTGYKGRCGIYEAIKENALLAKYAGGLGNDWTPVRSLGAHIKGTNGKSQGVIPFLKVVNDNQGTIRAVDLVVRGYSFEQLLKSLSNKYQFLSKSDNQAWFQNENTIITLQYYIDRSNIYYEHKKYKANSENRLYSPIPKDML